VLIEQSAYANRWREVAPAAKGCFALGGLVAAFVAGTPAATAGIALVLMAVTLLGARVSPWLYLRVAVPAAAFLAISSLSLMFSVNIDAQDGFRWQFAPDAMPRIATVASRSLASLAALLLLVLTTPLRDLISLLRRLRVPEVILDLMVLCYRMLFVLSEAMHDTITAQSARLGYATTRRSLHSLGLLAANLAVQVWQRAQGLATAALARNGGGSLRFLSPGFAHARRDTCIAAIAGVALIALAGSLGR
jgi:cobalt/nickel transport system permease protein